MGLLIGGHFHGILSMASSLWSHHGHALACQWDASLKEVVEAGVVGERGVVDSMEFFHG